MTKTGDVRVWFASAPPRQALHIYVRNIAEALAVMATLEASTAYETVHGIRREVEFQSGISRYEPDGLGYHAWFDVADWELDAVQRVLDSA